MSRPSSYILRPLRFKWSPTMYGGHKFNLRIYKLHAMTVFGKPPWSPRWQFTLGRPRGGFGWRISILGWRNESRFQFMYWDRGTRRKGERQQYLCPKCGHHARRTDFVQREFYPDKEK